MILHVDMDAFCRIVEFGAVRFTLPDGELEHFEQLVDPECVIPSEVTAIHGITNAMVRGMPTVPEALPAFLDFLGGPDTVLLAHNASFDLGFLGFAMAKLGSQSPPNPVIDTLALSRKCLGNSLVTACKT